jgi:hypothetical protein
MDFWIDNGPARSMLRALGASSSVNHAYRRIRLRRFRTDTDRSKPPNEILFA